MQNRKQTAWRKSRKFGDVQGGRLRPKLTDNIFNRAHSLVRPSPNQALPILIEENSSRDFMFPVSAAEACERLQLFPQEHVKGITHIWLRRAKKNEYQEGKLPLAEFICGSGVRVIVLYPWPKNLIQNFGESLPTKKRMRELNQWTLDWFQENGQWRLRWTLEAVRDFYLNNLIPHEVGHHLDWYLRHWSKAGKKQQEDFADQYAVQWGAAAKAVMQASAL